MYDIFHMQNIGSHHKHLASSSNQTVSISLHI